jgi:hypothetical protein
VRYYNDGVWVDGVTNGEGVNQLVASWVLSFPLARPSL